LDFFDKNRVNSFLLSYFTDPRKNKQLILCEKAIIEGEIISFFSSFFQSHHTSNFDTYRVCKGLWPSLMFADDYIEPQNFWASSKSHVATTYLCMHFCSNYIGWSNQGKYYKIETHYAKQDVAT
jgi:hypothetical protein